MDSEDHKVHLSVKDVQDTLEAYQCLKCTKFHCPLCPKDNIKFDENFQATGHLQSHLSWVVVHGCFKIYKCHLLCRKTTHYHCCYCDKTVIRRTDFKKHLLIHTADKSAGGQATRTVANNQGEKSFTLVHGPTDQPSAMASERRDQQPTMVCGPTDQPSAMASKGRDQQPIIVHGPSDQPSAMASKRRDQQPTIVCGPTNQSSAMASKGRDQQPIIVSGPTDQPSTTNQKHWGLPSVGQELKRHKSSQKKVSCPKCNVTLYLKNLQRHIQRKHRTEKIDMCVDRHLASQCIDARNALKRNARVTSRSYN
nr:uncharacterized protein LOC129444957 isoform X1 [Misgurnus anguillicaudatus]